MSCTCKYGSGARCCQVCQHRAHTNKRLETLEAAATLLDEAFAKGRAAERAAIVADLRAMSALCENSGKRRISLYTEGLADRYERGEHEEGKR